MADLRGSLPNNLPHRPDCSGTRRVEASLDGIPLAIELAATRVKVLAVDQIASRLDDRFRLLTGGSQRVPRQQTLRATMDWSYSLLSERERTLLRRLSVFAGGWTLEAAEAVCGGNGVEASAVLDVLTQLVNKSLVVAETRDGEARYRLLETVRQYGHDRLLESGEAAGVQMRHLDWCVALAESTYPEMSEYEWECREATLRRLQTELDNLRAAMAWSLEVNPESALRMAGALGRFWTSSNRLAEGQGWLAKALERTKEISNLAKARALRHAGHLAHLRAANREAAVLAEEGAAIARRLEDKEILAGSLSVVGFAHQMMGNHERALGLFEECRGLYQELGDRVHVADMVRVSGFVAVKQGDYPRANTLFDEAVGLFRQAGAQ
jgi:tetratricopeptide (TPR) repeat protein